jgi:hypothetical protein
LFNGLSSSDRRENLEQISSSHIEGQTEAQVSKQGRIEGERKEVDVKDYPKAAAIASLEGLEVSGRQKPNNKLCWKGKTTG